MKPDYIDHRHLPEWLQLEAEPLGSDRRERALTRIALALAAMVIALLVAFAMIQLGGAPTPNARGGEPVTLTEYQRIEALCIAAQRRNPHQLSCDFGSIEDARAWERVYRAGDGVAKP